MKSGKKTLKPEILSGKRKTTIIPAFLIKAGGHHTCLNVLTRVKERGDIQSLRSSYIGFTKGNKLRSNHRAWQVHGKSHHGDVVCEAIPEIAQCGASYTSINSHTSPDSLCPVVYLIPSNSSSRERCSPGDSDTGRTNWFNIQTGRWVSSCRNPGTINAHHD